MTLLPTFSLDLGNLGGGGNIGWRDGVHSTHTLDCNGNIGVAHTLRADGFDASEDGTGDRTDALTTQTDPSSQIVAFHENQRAELTMSAQAGALKNGGGKPGQGYPAALHGMQVRRLTPTECERLQGFPDGYTAITYRGKPAADGPRYRALGNSMAVPVLRWLLTRIEAHDAAMRAAA
jgi:DNA (cytosine-5)-methyltransferase 1